eukprot:TRINITY_DN9426_c0_g1_i1.p1 TRINITY_DN9426_c0_g1~~TRINITY_DN9426_c0_g1_i1.p1  ORF type:complete len:248 (+),score=55.76 TRINITY_DN9426_c0_g1_i1:700-1443(+)
MGCDDQATVADRKEAYDMFSAGGFMHSCDLAVALQAAGFTRVPRERIEKLRKVHTTGHEIPFEAFHAMCCDLAGRCIPMSGAPNVVPEAQAQGARPVYEEEMVTVPARTFENMKREVHSLRAALQTERAKVAVLQQQAYTRQQQPQRMHGAVPVQPAARTVPQSMASAIDEVSSMSVESCSDEAIETLLSQSRKLSRMDVIEALGTDDKNEMKKMLAKLHPDRTTIPCVKTTLQKRFQLVNYMRNLV